MRTIQERVEADSRVVAFNTEISACVAEAGMEWTSLNDVYEQFEPRLNQLQPAMFGAGDPFADAGLDPEEMSERELEEFIIEMNRLDPESLAILAEIQSDEIALASVVITCGGGPLNEQVLMSDVRVEYERAFLNENAEALAEFVPGS